MEILQYNDIDIGVNENTGGFICGSLPGCVVFTIENPDDDVIDWMEDRGLLIRNLMLVNKDKLYIVIPPIHAADAVLFRLTYQIERGDYIEY